ncbi:hypothetical protein VX037_18620 [Gordonia sp. Z-3]|uniref:hypothetical protein n=1 Tax=Gordonia sp. Z-3 TaxID=3115408 RepID=UPI002E28B26C|nr:hypothetical protein [Gordonia sp. Z-3]MED5803042.1 hypothetical protein [Gordonia sp. Z-3]
MNVLLAEAGLSECARDAACSADFSGPFPIGIALLILLPVWFTLSMFASVDVISRHIGFRRSVIGLGVVWIIPIVGVVVWHSSRRAALQDHREMT